MNIQAGLYYRTRDGRKAFVSAVLLPNPFGASASRVALGYITGGEGCYSWSENGRYRGELELPNDLTDEWREPIIQKIFVGLGENNKPFVVTQIFDMPCRPKCAKEITVTITEGDVEVQS